MMGRFWRGWKSIVMASQFVRKPIRPLTEVMRSSPSSASEYPKAEIVTPGKSQRNEEAKSIPSRRGMPRK